MRGGVWAGLVAVACLGVAGPGLGALTERVSVNDQGEEGNEGSAIASISADGRWVAFYSQATNLTTGSPAEGGTFIRDRLTRTTFLAVPGAGGAISGDGRYVVFHSSASDLVPDDTNGEQDAFVLDLETRAIERVSLAANGEQANGGSWIPSIGVAAISGEGRYVLFNSTATNLLRRDAIGVGAGFVRDRTAVTTECVTVDMTGRPVEGAVFSISEDGRYVVFMATDLTPGDRDGLPDIYVRDRLSHTTRLASCDASGRPLAMWCYGPAISGDGSTVAFTAFEFDLAWWFPTSPYRIFARDLRRGTIEWIDPPPNSPADQSIDSFYPSISRDGRFVAFGSKRPTLVPGELSAGIFVRDRVARTTTRVDVTVTGTQANYNSYYPFISADGRFVAFSSDASNLAVFDRNRAEDAFVTEWQRDCTFPDVPPDYWAWREVEGCAAYGYITGYPDGNFHPGETVTRDQAAVYLARAHAWGESGIPDGPATPTFSDVATDYWAYKYVEYLVDWGIARGYGDRYRPSVSLDRAQMAVFVARAMAGGEANVPDDPDQTAFFTDVSGTHWAYKYVEYCHDQGVVAGYWDGYHPEESVTRAQMAVYVQRAFDLPI